MPPPTLSEWPYNPFGNIRIYKDIDWSRVPNEVIEDMTEDDLKRFVQENRLDNMTRLTKSVYCPDWIKEYVLKIHNAGRAISLPRHTIESAKMQIRINELGRASIPVQGIIEVMLKAIETGTLPSANGDQILGPKERLDLMKILLNKGLSDPKSIDVDETAANVDRAGRTAADIPKERLRKLSDAELAEMIRNKMNGVR